MQTNLLLATLTCTSQISKLKDIAHLKESKIIVGLSGDKEEDDNLRSIVEKFWHSCPVVQALPEAEAREMAKADENFFLIFIGSHSTISFESTRAVYDNFKDTFRYIPKDYYVGISTGKRKNLFLGNIPAFDDEITEEAIASGINQLQQILSMS